VAINYIKNYFKAKTYLYKDCSDLPIYNFDVIYRTQDYRYLVKGYDGYEGIEIPKEAEQRWKDIFDEWVKACDDSTITYYYQLILEVAYLETRYYVSKIMLHQIYTRYPESMSEDVLDLYIAELKRWKYHYNKENDVLDEIARLLDQHKASSNKLGIKKSELEELKGDDDIENIQTLEKQAVILEHITGIRPNIFKDSVIKWLEIGKLASSINQQRRKNGK
jgi:hypothetical protein